MLRFKQRKRDIGLVINECHVVTFGFFCLSFEKHTLLTPMLHLTLLSFIGQRGCKDRVSPCKHP